MQNKIVVFADTDIYEAIETQIAQQDEFEIYARAFNFAECLEQTLEANVAAIIVQATDHIITLIRFLNDLDEQDVHPVFLLFAKDAGAMLNISITDSEDIVMSEKALYLFGKSVEKQYQYQRNCYCPALKIITNREYRDGMMGRQEALHEIIRGSSAQDIENYISYYNLDLRRQGYYLLFWELQRLEYVGHALNKEVYYMAGDLLEEEFVRIIKQYAGGEVFRLTPNKRCIIINDIPSYSAATKRERLEAELNQLVEYGTNDATICFLSERIEDERDFRVARDRYENAKANAFFMRELKLIRMEKIYGGNTPEPDVDEVYPLIQAIGNYIHYNINNPILLSSLHTLYFDFLKKTRDYSLYYFCIAYIYSAIAKEYKQIDPKLLTENLNPDLLRFSSIERQYEIMRSQILDLRSKQGGKVKSKSILLLETKEYIMNNYANDITVAEIADSLFVSRIYLSQLFKKEFGVSVIGYIINYRIERSMMLLEATDEPVYSIASAVGFNDARHFSKTFKRQVGLSPKEYRAEQHKP